MTSDRLSESVDLHGGCGTMVHFDLDWSPLRMMQRVGRLWRHSGFLKNGNGRRTGLPPFPAVFHLRYPCSTDDEIYSRLQRRWHRLSELELGLDFISFESCLGRKLGGWRERSDELLGQDTYLARPVDGDEGRHAHGHARHADGGGDDREQAFALGLEIAEGDEEFEAHWILIL
ncbi:MAG TPA: hypothetical protein DCZ01_10140 [Elusimicrobia bacterium]|nr:hypothetical protein [Elusimicrobiota bacterium]